MAGVSYRDLYELLDARTNQILETFENFKTKEFEPLRAKVERIWFYITLATGVTVVVFEVVVKEIFGKVFRHH